MNNYYANMIAQVAGDGIAIVMWAKVSALQKELKYDRQRFVRHQRTNNEIMHVHSRGSVDANGGGAGWVGRRR
jgi:glutamine cyclotransferase